MEGVIQASLVPTGFLVNLHTSILLHSPTTTVPSMSSLTSPDSETNLLDNVPPVSESPETAENQLPQMNS